MSTTKLDRDTLRSARYRRLDTMTRIQKLTRELDDKEKPLASLLQNSVPASLSMFINVEGVIGRLLAYGETSDKIVYKFSENLYGFESAKEVRAAFRALKKAWNDTIDVEFSLEEPHRIEVRLRIV